MVRLFNRKQIACWQTIYIIDILEEKPHVAKNKNRAAANVGQTAAASDKL